MCNPRREILSMGCCQDNAILREVLNDFRSLFHSKDRTVFALWTHLFEKRLLWKCVGHTLLHSYCRPFQDYAPGEANSFGIEKCKRERGRKKKKSEIFLKTKANGSAISYPI